MTTDLKGSCVLSHHFEDTRSHDIVDTLSHHIVHRFRGGVGEGRGMSNSLSPRTRASIIKYDPTQPHALTVTEFCRSV